MMPPPAAATAVTLLSTTHSFYNVNFKVISNRNMFSNVILSDSLVHNNKLAHFVTAESGTTRYAMWIFNPLMRTTFIKDHSDHSDFIKFARKKNRHVIDFQCAVRNVLSPPKASHAFACGKLSSVHLLAPKLLSETEF